MKAIVMIKEISLLLTLLVFVSCGKEINQLNKIKKGFENYDRTSLKIEPEFRPYFDTFMEKSSCFGQKPAFKNLQISMVEDIPSELPGMLIQGRCERKPTVYSPLPIMKITINEKIWPNLSTPQKERLIYHEMAHCTLDIEHHDDLKSIMANDAAHLTDWEYINNYTELIEGMWEENSSCEFSFNPSRYSKAAPTEEETLENPWYNRHPGGK